MVSIVEKTMSAAQLENLIIHKAERGDISRLEFIVEAMNMVKESGYFARQFDHQKHGTRQVYITMQGGVDAGYCILNWKPKYALFKKLGIPEIQDLNVLPHFRRQGIATSMIAHCEAEAQAKGLEYMGISVSVSSQFGPAQILYTRLGYIPDGNGVTYDRKQTAPGEFRPLDDQLCLMMMKKLSPG